MSQGRPLGIFSRVAERARKSRHSNPIFRCCGTVRQGPVLGQETQIVQP